MTTDNKNNGDEEVRFILVLIAIWLTLVLGICLTGCKSSSRAIDNNHSTSDTLVHTSTAKDSLSHSVVESDTLKNSTHVSDTTYTGHYEKSDTLYKNFTDHWLKTTDSISVAVDSVTGDITFHYYTRTHEREITKDTVVINNTVRDTLYRSIHVRDSVSEYKRLLESVYRDYTALDSTYKALRDSVNSSRQETVVKEESLWAKVKRSLRSSLLTLVIVACVALGVTVYFKKKN